MPINSLHFHPCWEDIQFYGQIGKKASQGKKAYCSQDVRSSQPYPNMLNDIILTIKGGTTSKMWSTYLNSFWA